MAASILGAQSDSSPEVLSARIQSRMRENLSRLPNYTCRQTVERSRRNSPERPFQPLDTLRLEVVLAGNREMYSWQDADRFEEKELADMIGYGVIGTGTFALLAKHVFTAGVADFTWRGAETLEGRPAVRFDYDVPRNRSSYLLRVRPRQTVIGFHGSFWADAGTLDLLRLDARADEIPEELGVAELRIRVDYARVPMGDATFLLPRSAEFGMLGASGEENRNLTRFTACRQYQSESKLSFSETATDRLDSSQPPAEPEPLAGLPLELSLDMDIDLERAAVGDPVRSVLTRPVKIGERIVIPEGAVALGRVLGIQKQTQPFEHYIVALQFHTLSLPGRRAPLMATMEDAGPAPGLIRPARHLNPTFSRQRRPRMDVLVAEQRAGQGVLYWLAKHPRLPRGLKMRWRIQSVGPPPAPL